MLVASLARVEYEFKAIRKLGISILIRAAQDAFLEKPTINEYSRTDIIKRDAINFLTGKSRPEDLCLICEMAGVDPQMVMYETTKLINNGKKDIKTYMGLFSMRKDIK